MSRIVRSSKFRHVFGAVFKKEDCYDELKVTRSSWDTNLIAANPLYFAVIFEAAGGGSFCVTPWTEKGKWDAKDPLVTGHKQPVLDLDWNPFNDSLIASVSEDCTAKIWGLPEGGLKENMTEPLQTLNGHKRKVGCVKFNPLANNILATASTDLAVKIWDIEKGKDILQVEAQHADIIQAIDWNYHGSLLATSCKDKKVRLIDVRQQKIASEVEAHLGIKGSRVCWLGRKEKLFSVGFTKTSEREYCIWDPRDMSKTLSRTSIDSGAGVIMPFYDDDTCVLFLGGKGDGNIRYYEVVDTDPYIYYLTEFKSATPQRGLCMLPKRAVNVSECEIVRMCKVGPKLMEPISFQVPRKSDQFQDDIFPDTFGGEPSLSAAEWLAGKTAEPKLVSLAHGFTPGKKVIEFNPEKPAEEKVLSEHELRQEVEKLTKRVAYLEAELIKRDQKIATLAK